MKAYKQDNNYNFFRANSYFNPDWAVATYRGLKNLAAKFVSRF
jgi:hypothetical protein